MTALVFFCGACMFSIWEPRNSSPGHSVDEQDIVLLFLDVSIHITSANICGILKN
jgi:hypothetical protein